MSKKNREKYVREQIKKFGVKDRAERMSLFSKFKKGAEHFENQIIALRLRENIRSQINGLLRNKYKDSSILEYLGCTVDELRIHLEKQFREGMSWDTWGVRGWHIDHIRPLSSFNLSDWNDFNAACHYTNLQPLWWRENISKGKKYQRI